ncbi:MAG: radical SAM protein [Nanoarchaeota archaeon]|nr:radical SAM protein [Nanoarchaeota archaeon]
MLSEAPVRYQFDKGRVIVSTGGRCPVGCQYCYTYSPSFVGFPEREPGQVVADLRANAGKFQLVQLGYDTELFLPGKVDSTLQLMRGIAGMGKDISFATRMVLTPPTIDALADIYAGMRGNNSVLVAFESIIGYETARKFERNAPDPEERVKTVHRLHERGIPTFVYVRPLMPVVTDTEIARLFAETEGHCLGRIVGPMIYQREIAERLFGVTADERAVMPWALDQREWNVHLDKRIRSLMASRGAFFRSQDAVNFARLSIGLEARVWA